MPVTSQHSGIDIGLVTGDVTVPKDPVNSLRGADIDSAYSMARERRKRDRVHPVTTEEWGVAPSFVRARESNILKIREQRN